MVGILPVLVTKDVIKKNTIFFKYFSIRTDSLVGYKAIKKERKKKERKKERKEDDEERKDRRKEKKKRKYTPPGATLIKPQYQYSKNPQLRT